MKNNNSSWRAGISRPPRPTKEPANSYEWPCPGDLLHMDVSRYARFERPGHALTGDRSRTSAEVDRRVGYDYAHALVDDHSRLAYVELHGDERAATVTGFVERGLAFFERHGFTFFTVTREDNAKYECEDTIAHVLRGCIGDCQGDRLTFSRKSTVKR